MNYPQYSVAIRTLGLAGEKFEREINSILHQKHKPVEIFAYIPDGYAIPTFENSQHITWIRSPKGMITQRALSFKEIKTDYILFLDDDLELGDDSVESMFKGLVEHDGDAIVANMFANHDMKPLQKALYFMLGTRFFKSDNWAFKVRRSGYYSYNITPPEMYYFLKPALERVVW